MTHNVSRIVAVTQVKVRKVSGLGA